MKETGHDLPPDVTETTGDENKEIRREEKLSLTEKQEVLLPLHDQLESLLRHMDNDNPITDGWSSMDEDGNSLVTSSKESVAMYRSLGIIPYKIKDLRERLSRASELLDKVEEVNKMPDNDKVDKAIKRSWPDDYEPYKDSK